MYKIRSHNTFSVNQTCPLNAFQIVSILGGKKLPSYFPFRKNTISFGERILEIPGPLPLFFPKKRMTSAILFRGYRPPGFNFFGPGTKRFLMPQWGIIYLFFRTFKMWRKKTE